MNMKPSYTQAFDSIANSSIYCGIERQEVLLMRQQGKEYPSFPLENRLYIRLALYSRAKTFHTPSEEKEDYWARMLRKAEQTLLRCL